MRLLASSGFCCTDVGSIVLTCQRHYVGCENRLLNSKMNKNQVCLWLQSSLRAVQKSRGAQVFVGSDALPVHRVSLSGTFKRMHDLNVYVSSQTVVLGWSPANRGPTSGTTG